MPTFDLAVALRIVRRSLHVGHSGQADEFAEVSSDELGTVVGDDSRFRFGVEFAGTLQNRLDVDFLHRLPDFPVNEEAAEAIQN